MSLDLIVPFLKPIKHLLVRNDISEIMCNPDSTYWYEQDGIIRRAHEVEFEPGALGAALEVIANTLGKRLDSDTPILNVRLPDGSRLAAMIPPVVRPEPLLTIRKFTSREFGMGDLIRREMLTADTAELLCEHVRRGSNILISGSTGAGKTTLLNILAQAIPDDQRIAIIEDTAELHLKQPHVFYAESQTDTHKSTVTYDDLLRAALRHRPDRIIVGEVRGPEARTLLDALNTGHSGSLSTIHASTACGALRRLTSLAARAHVNASPSNVAEEVSGAFSIAVHLERVKERRCVKDVVKITGFHSRTGEFRVQNLYASLL